MKKEERRKEKSPFQFSQLSMDSLLVKESYVSNVFQPDIIRDFARKPDVKSRAVTEDTMNCCIWPV
jgi:hypothetical protein